MNKKVVILSFSGRNGGNCDQISNFTEQFYIRTNVLSYKIDVENFGPCGGCSCECLTPGAVCPKLTQAQKKIMDDICDSDLVYFIVPNYCGYPCANYFAFNERSVGYFNMDKDLMERYMNVRKRFIIVSNSEGSNFEDAMRQQTNEDPEILYLKTRKYQKQSIAGNLLTSEAAKADLKAFLALDQF